MSDELPSDKEARILTEVRILNVQFNELRISFDQFRLGIGSRVEQSGKDIAVLQTLHERVRAVESAIRWLVGLMVGGFVASLWSLIRK